MTTPLLVCAHASEAARLRGALPVVVTGVGKAPAAAIVATELSRVRPPFVLLFGLGGAYPRAHGGEGLAVGSACLVGRDELVDEGVATPTGFLSLLDLELEAPRVLQADPERTAVLARRLGAPIVRGATVSTCAGTDELSRQRARGRAVESMEGAAVALACAHAEVPWVQLRVIGNTTGNRDDAAFDLALACETLQGHVLRIAAEGWP